MNDNMIPSQDVRIVGIDPLESPSDLARKYPLSKEQSTRISEYRATISNILRGIDNRLLAVVGPCSIHDPEAALEYADKLRKLSDQVSDVLFVVMRTYFEKPRTTVGWKGLLLDPDLNGTYDIEKGLEVARKLLLEISNKGLPLGCEVLDPIVPQYIDELMSWSSIGARTTESQTHRNLASGLSVPVGFKNSTSGDLTNAINAIRSAAAPASFIGINKEGMTSVFRTKGNDCGHLILRGGSVPNYYEDDVENARKLLEKNGMNPAIIIDCSHGNSRKDFTRQKRVLRSVIDQVAFGERAIKGFMLESNLFEGNQSIDCSKDELKYGVSVTDACIGWDETERIMLHSAEILRKVRQNGPMEVL
ncbi:MAG: 3-deoxy-7-phosphoheptulonate synthase [Spirochaetales bacterium]|nr:3-deoxy-7-phosphoheptulonate synthase [Spirochaetales bacterium]